MKARNILKKAFVDLEKIAKRMSARELQDAYQELERLSERAGEIAAYLEMRYGSGCGDQGHESAVKALNRAGKIIHTKAFGYNAYHDISF